MPHCDEDATQHVSSSWGFSSLATSGVFCHRGSFPEARGGLAVDSI